MSIYPEEPNSKNLFPQYLRRPDLDGATRLSIGFEAWQRSSYGCITGLAQRYDISRQFVYDLRDQVKELSALCSPCPRTGGSSDALKASLRFILEHRLIGKSSIGAISEMMKRQGLAYSSTGFISRVLGLIGESLPQSLSGCAGLKLMVVFASDEVFARRKPILVTVDPVSSAILGIELAAKRDSETWQKHWQRLAGEGIGGLYVVSDQGRGLVAAREAIFPGQAHQTDSYHGVAHALGAWQKRLESAAYQAIGAEYEAERLVESAKSEAVMAKRLDRYLTAQKKVLLASNATTTFVSSIKSSSNSYRSLTPKAGSMTPKRHIRTSPWQPNSCNSCSTKPSASKPKNSKSDCLICSSSSTEPSPS